MKRLLPVFAVFALLLLPLSGFATASTRHHHARKAQVHETAHARHHMARLARSRREVAASHPRSSRHAVHQASVTTTTHLVRRHGRLVRVSVHHYSRHRYVEQFTADSFTNSNVGADDIATGENPVVRQAALTRSATCTAPSS
jgi:penicillin-binding protein 2